MSLKAYDNELQKLRAGGFEPDMKLWKLRAADCVPALEKKKLADWAITKFNLYHDLEDHSSNSYNVWIHSSSEVPLCCHRP